MQTTQACTDPKLAVADDASVLHQLLKEPLALPAMLWRPAYVESSAWIEHVPFALWIVQAIRPAVIVELGSHWGTSYFAFCQAADRLAYGAQCYAVDTWMGDEHSGTYGEQVFEQVSRFNKTHFSGFSDLIRSTFDQALTHFADGSIDLLHIDGLHTEEAVRHDFESWLPKLSDRGVVLLHDTNVRERGFGVFKLFAELASRYPSFEFSHGHGLGVIAVGRQVPAAIAMLVEAGERSDSPTLVRALFSRLGQACSAELSSSKQAEQIKKLNATIGRISEQVVQQQQMLEQTQSNMSRQVGELDQAQQQLAMLEQAHAFERGQLAERITLLEQIRAQLQSDNTNLQSRLDHLSIRLAGAENDRTTRAAEATRHLQEKETLTLQLVALRSEAGETADRTRQMEARLLEQETVITQFRQLALANSKTLQDHVDRLRSDLNAAEVEAKALRLSLSWRLTAPLRLLLRPFLR